MKNEIEILNKINIVKPVLNELSENIDFIFYETIRIFTDSTIVMFSITITYLNMANNAQIVYDKFIINSFIKRNKIDGITITKSNEEGRNFIEIIINT